MVSEAKYLSFYNVIGDCVLPDDKTGENCLLHCGWDELPPGGERVSQPGVVGQPGGEGRELGQQGGQLEPRRAARPHHSHDLGSLSQPANTKPNVR